MAPKKLLFEILEARFDLEFCEDHEKASRAERLDRLINRAVLQTIHSKRELLEALNHKYLEYKRGRLRQDRLGWGL